MILRPVEPSDSGAMFAYRADPAVMRFQTWVPAKEHDVSAFIQEQKSIAFNTPGTWFQLSILLKDSLTLIGDCGMHFPEDEPEQAELGITLAPSHHGQGYATESLLGVLERLFTAGKHRIFARADPRNKASVRLLRRVGMREEGLMRESVWVRGEWTDDALFAMLKREWFDRGKTNRLQSG